MKIISFNESLKKGIHAVYNKNVGEFYKPMSYEYFNKNYFNHIEFDNDGVFVAVENDEVIGFIFSHIRKIEKDDNNFPGYISVLLVDKDYRHQGIGKALLNKAECYLNSKGKNKICFGYIGTINMPWYIPNTDHHDHNGAPGPVVNSDLYCFLLNNGYDVIDEEDAFHLDLCKFNMPEKVKEDLAKLENEGIKIEIYDPSKHYGIDEFYQDINSEPFERVIRYNLSLDEPKPFAVVSANGKIGGWTGAFYTEESGRAHFDGIIVAPYMRGKGLGRALFATLAEYSKTHGSVFMTFFTGRTNFARYIYLSLGFKIIQSFAVMQKEVK